MGPALPCDAASVAAYLTAAAGADSGTRLAPFPPAALRAAFEEGDADGLSAAATALVARWLGAAAAAAGRQLFVAFDTESLSIVSTQLVDVLTAANTGDASGAGHPSEGSVGVCDPHRATFWAGDVSVDAGPEGTGSATAVVSLSSLPAPLADVCAATTGAADPPEDFHWARGEGETLVHFGRAATVPTLRGAKCVAALTRSDGTCGTFNRLGARDAAPIAGASVNEALRVVALRAILGAVGAPSGGGSFAFTYSQRPGGPYIPTALRAIARYLAPTPSSCGDADRQPPEDARQTLAPLVLRTHVHVSGGRTTYAHRIIAPAATAPRRPCCDAAPRLRFVGLVDEEEPTSYPHDELVAARYRWSSDDGSAKSGPTSLSGSDDGVRQSFFRPTPVDSPQSALL